MANVVITYNGETITRLDSEGMKVLNTSGKYCSDNISVTYSKPYQDKPVRFYDYDGTLLYSYAASEFAELSEMPPNPTHEGLTAQGWNWSLEDAKSYVATYGLLIIGQMYSTYDGKTRIYINLKKGITSLYFSLFIDGSVDIDWGDDSEHSTMTGSSLNTLQKIQHEYPENGGEFELSFEVRRGRVRLPGAEYSSYPTRLIWGNYGGYKDGPYAASITKIEIGSGVESIRNYCFNYCTSLESITIPNTVESVFAAFRHTSLLKCVILPKDTEYEGLYSISGSGMIEYGVGIETVSIPKNTALGNGTGSHFDYAYSLKNISLGLGSNWGNAGFHGSCSLQKVAIPSSFTEIHNDAFNGCYALQEVTLPDTITSIGSGAFASCYALTSLTIPSSVTSISSQAFADTGLRELHFRPTTPPTVSNSNAFRNLANACLIYVPYSEDHSILEAYQSASNYPSSENYSYLEEGSSI